MQSIRKAPSRAGGVGKTLSLLLLGAALTLAALFFCLNHLQSDIESDLSSRVTTALDGTGLTTDNISVEGLDVTLTGAIETEIAREEMARLTGRVFGVARVFNNLTVDGQAADAPDTRSETEKQLSATLLAEEDASDSAASEAIAQETLKLAKPAELILNPPAAAVSTLAPSTLLITADKGTVNIQGIVPDKTIATRIRKAVEEKFGDSNVNDEISVYKATAVPPWLTGALAVIDQMDNISNPILKITEDTAIFGGTVSSETLGAQKTGFAKRLLGSQLAVSGEFDVAASDANLPTPQSNTRVIVKRPASLKIRAIDDSIILSGIVGSDQDANAVRKQMRSAFGQFDDSLVIDDSVAPAEWFDDAVRLGAASSSIPNFSVSINSGQLLLGGEVPDRERGRELQSQATELIGDQLVVVNNYTVIQRATIADSREELLTRQLRSALDQASAGGITFKKNSATPIQESTVVLDKVAEAILQFEGQIIEISGHTDSSGDALANLELSKKRAVAVRDYLVEKNVPTSQLRPIGYGETDPIADNTTAQGRSANRRIEFNLEVESR
ncbi:hypothetical protein AB833_22625 [Chromatiales bacterium (ex Bugula neritina AB1)]|nr:hypothetical protein AB833_22625 [Chromatiales bacterium (ex Bugula neritina AB1)]